MANYLDEQGLALYDSLLKQTIPDSQVQSNWNETDTSSKAYIQNKPTLVTPGDTVGGRVNAQVAELAIQAVNSDWAFQMFVNGLYDGEDLREIQYASSVPVGSPEPTGLLKRTGNRDQYGNPEWTFDTNTYATTSQIPNVPIETISVNGTAQTITNKNVDISVPVHGQIASGNTGYVTGGDVYSWGGNAQHIYPVEGASYYTIPTGYSVGDVIILIQPASGSNDIGLKVSEGSWWWLDWVGVGSRHIVTNTSSSYTKVGVGSSAQECVTIAIRVS